MKWAHLYPNKTFAIIPNGSFNFAIKLREGSCLRVSFEPVFCVLNKYLILSSIYLKWFIAGTIESLLLCLNVYVLGSYSDKVLVGFTLFMKSFVIIFCIGKML